MEQHTGSFKKKRRTSVNNKKQLIPPMKNKDRDKHCGVEKEDKASLLMEKWSCMETLTLWILKPHRRHCGSKY